MRAGAVEGDIGWHHQLNAHEFEQTLGDSEGQGSLACCKSTGSQSRTQLATEQQPIDTLMIRFLRLQVTETQLKKFRH